MQFTKEEVDALFAASGQKQGGAPKFAIPEIRFSGATGEFRLVEPSGEETPLNNPIKLVVLRKRRILSSTQDVSKDGHESYLSHFTNEFESVNQMVSLYKSQDKKVSFVETATPKVLREKYKDLKTKEVVYCLFDHGDKMKPEIVKMEIRGASLSAYFDFQSKVKEGGNHSFQILTEIETKAGKKGAVRYHSMTFTEGEVPFSFPEIKEAMDTVRENLTKVDAYFTSKQLASTDVVPDMEHQSSQADPALDIPDNDTINPEDIPF